MKILELTMLIFQYAYYDAREADKRRNWTIRATKFRVIAALGLIETLVLAAVYLAIARIILGHHIPRSPLPSFVSPVLLAFAYGLILYFVNVRIVGRDSRVHYYKKIFDSWDKWKRLRWRILLISIMVLSLAASYVVCEVTQNGCDVQNWK